MSISILVLGAPFDCQSSYTAYRYTEAALMLKQPIHRVFFYQAGIHTASNLTCPPRDEFDLCRAWQFLKSEYQLDLVVCIAAAARRGLIDESEAKRHSKPAFNISDSFELSGLGQLVDAIANSDKLITFGA
jgi:tRNA 2-thiouridine synthesizing protein D